MGADVCTTCLQSADALHLEEGLALSFLEASFDVTHRLLVLRDQQILQCIDALLRAAQLGGETPKGDLDFGERDEPRHRGAKPCRATSSSSDVPSRPQLGVSRMASQRSSGTTTPRMLLS